MAERWYPVIDYSLCIECGSCTKKCSHGVYDLIKAPTPVVTNPIECVNHCHGCGNLCPVGAISYVGDDTGWVAPALKKKKFTLNMDINSECGCQCKMIKKNDKEILIEYLYLDLNSCDRCIGTDKVLEQVINELAPAFKLAGYSLVFNKIEMTSIELAEKYHFLSSPTIRVNGTDICESVVESDCGCCSEISGTSVDCRVFEYERKKYEVPPVEMIAKELLLNAFSDKTELNISDYHLPENLRNFFEGKTVKITVAVAIVLAVENRKGDIIMRLFGLNKKKEEIKETKCCCGGKCDSETMAKAEELKKNDTCIKVLGSGCAKCNALESAIREALEELGMDTTIEHVTDFAQIATYGVMSTPALVVDGKVVSFGKVLKKEEVIKILQTVRG